MTVVCGVSLWGNPWLGPREPLAGQRTPLFYVCASLKPSYITLFMVNVAQAGSTLAHACMKPASRVLSL